MDFFKGIASESIPMDDFAKYYSHTAPVIERAPVSTIAEDISNGVQLSVANLFAYLSDFATPIQDIFFDHGDFSQVTENSYESCAYSTYKPFEEENEISSDEYPFQFIGQNDEEYQMSWEKFSYFTPVKIDSFYDTANYATLNVICDIQEDATFLPTLKNYIQSTFDLNFARLISVGGVEFTYPAIYSAESIQSASVSMFDRMTRQPHRDPSILLTDSFFMRRGVVIVLDTTIDERLSSLLSYNIGGDVVESSYLSSATSNSSSTTSQSSSNIITYESLLTGLMAALSEYISLLNEHTYLAVVDTNGDWMGYLFPSDSTAAKTCLGSTNSVKTGGLTRMTSNARTALVDNLTKYFASLSLDGHTVSNQTNSTYAEENNPLFSTTELAIQLLRSSVDPTIDLPTILDEKSSSTFLSSITERDQLSNTGRPLAQGSPLSMVFFSLGSTPHPYFLIWLRHQLQAISAAPILPMWMYINSQQMWCDSYGYLENQVSLYESHLKGKKNIHLMNAMYTDAVAQDLSRSTLLLESFVDTLKSLQIPVYEVSLSDAWEEARHLFHTFSADYSSEASTACGSVSDCDTDLMASILALKDTSEITTAMEFVKGVDKSFCLQIFVDMYCEGTIISAEDKAAHCGIMIQDASRDTLEFISSIIPPSFSSIIDPITGKSKYAITKPILSLSGEIVAFASTTMDMFVNGMSFYQRACEYNSNYTYILPLLNSKYESLYLTQRYSYVMFFDIYGSTISHQALVEGGMSATSVDIDILEPIITSEDGSTTFSELVLSKIIDSHIEEGSITATVARQMHINSSLVSNLTVEYRWHSTSDGVISVVCLGSPDTITVTDTVISDKCDESYPAPGDSIDADYSATDPLFALNSCLYPVVFSAVKHLTDEELSILGFSTMPSEYVLISGQMVLFGSTLYLDDEETMTRLGYSDESDMTIDLVQDLSNYYSGDPASQVWGNSTELSTSRIMSGLDYYWRSELGQSDTPKTVLYSASILDLFSATRVAFLDPPLSYSYNMRERDYFQESVSLDSSVYSYHFVPLYTHSATQEMVLSVVMPVPVTVTDISSVGINVSANKYSAKASFTMEITQQVVNESLCGQSNYTCFILSQTGIVLFVNDDTMMTIVEHSVEDGINTLFSDIAPGLGNALVEDGIFNQYSVYVPYIQSEESVFFSNPDIFSDSSTTQYSVSLSGESYTVGALSGVVNSECSDSAEEISYIAFEAPEVTTICVVVTNYPSEDLCEFSYTSTSSSSSSSSTGYTAQCDDTSTNEISHLWSMGTSCIGEQTCTGSSTPGIPHFCTFEGCSDSSGTKSYDVKICLIMSLSMLMVTILSIFAWLYL
ncbi:hypothetical protein ADUPG1_000651 [Aduncisulcus paluster]|uniref:Uncharacterized protein n=1 Tax=Aduncisulcus paluster TaxID=2918883 RepID=A0ABQ5KB68_9EUKA|nr:hypothetical protein ADUPG1_000651 [Aduncisulcus paluster]